MTLRRYERFTDGSRKQEPRPTCQRQTGRIHRLVARATIARPPAMVKVALAVTAGADHAA